MSTFLMQGKMKQGAKTNAIDDAAASWLAKIDRGVLTDDEQAAFDAWLIEDVRHRGAFVRMQAIFASSERISALGKGYVAHSVKSSGWGWAAGIAASIALAMTFFSAFPNADEHEPGYERNTEVAEAAPKPLISSTSNIDLPDGSRIELVAQARASTSFRSDARIVTLHGGEAFFAVAKDPTRPFTVVAGNVRVTAIGTSFTVSKENGRVSVKVVEGVVAIEREGEKGTTRLAANEMASFNARAIVAPVANALPNEGPKPTVGRPQMLAFEARPLSEAVHQFNTASVGNKIRVDPALKTMPITGLFSLSDPEGFAEAVALSLDAKVSREGGEIIIVP
jgi:transmembrane sensor